MTCQIHGLDWSRQEFFWHHDSQTLFLRFAIEIGQIALTASQKPKRTAAYQPWHGTRSKFAHEDYVLCLNQNGDGVSATRKVGQTPYAQITVPLLA
jgi:hypothetical protein